jgi:hypothetical protein
MRLALFLTLPTAHSQPCDRTGHRKESVGAVFQFGTTSAVGSDAAES